VLQAEKDIGGYETRFVAGVETAAFVLKAKDGHLVEK